MIGWIWSSSVDRACPYGVPLRPLRSSLRRHYSYGDFANFGRRHRLFCYVGVELSTAVSIGEDCIPTKRRRMYVPSAIHRCHRSRARDACHDLAKFEVQGRVEWVHSILLTPVHIWQIQGCIRTYPYTVANGLAARLSVSPGTGCA